MKTQRHAIIGFLILSLLVSTTSAVRRVSPYTRIDFLATGTEERSIKFSIPNQFPTANRDPIRGIIL